MSDDIVKWLRIDSSIRNELNDCITDPTTLNKAADEIERLRAENERLREEMERIADVSEKWTDSLVSQINEIARTALEGKK
jgi:hypothetical protein